MNHFHTLDDSEISKEELCLADNATTYTILTSEKYFSKLTMLEAKANTISASACENPIAICPMR